MKKEFSMNWQMTWTSVLLTSLTILPYTQASTRPKIVGGEPVKDLAETPYMVSLSGVCGGSIIAKKWVLTAAHCVGHYKAAKAGVLNLNETGHTFEIKRSIRHPQYKSWTNDYDYALVELATEINFKDTGLAPVELATQGFEDEGRQAPGTESIVYGFGRIGEGQNNTAKGLNKVMVPIVSTEAANLPEAYNGKITDSMLAAGFIDGGKDSCQGDSGGPLVVHDAANQPVLVGVVSWGTGCARKNKYGVYAKVSKVEAWIQETIKE